MRCSDHEREFSDIERHDEATEALRRVHERAKRVSQELLEELDDQAAIGNEWKLTDALRREVPLEPPHNSYEIPEPRSHVQNVQPKSAEAHTTTEEPNG